MAGVKSLLKAAANDMEQTTKARTNPVNAVTKTAPTEQSATNITHTSDKVKNVPIEQTKEISKPKNPGGRPTNKEKGIKSRKQYTLTLREDTYKLFLEKAGEEDLSFAKFMERAALEYIENHK